MPGVNYREFLIAGIFAQTVVFGATLTGAGLADDMQKGIIDRFRSLPMSRSAVLLGRTVSDLLNNVIVLVVMALTGLVVGWRIHTDVWHAAAGFLLLLAFSFAFSWIMACVGLIVPTPEVVNNAAFIVIFPITFIASTFVPLKSLPGVLKTFATWNPLTSLSEAGRNLFGNVPANPALRNISERLVDPAPGALHADLGRSSSWRSSCRWPSGSTPAPPPASQRRQHPDELVELGLDRGHQARPR